MSETALAHQDQGESSKPARGRPRDEEKNSAIIEAASQLFLEKGFDGASMDEVAKRAGVSKQTVYSHFSSKEQLFAESIHAAIEEHFPEQSVANLETHSLESDLRAVSGRFARLLISDRALAMHRVLVAAAPKGPALARIFWNAGPAEMMARTKAFIQAWADKGELVIDDVDKATGLLVSLLKGKLHFELSIGLIDSITEEELQAHIDDVVDCFLKLYRKA